jgi:tuftelin-interacting protein 11
MVTLFCNEFFPSWFSILYSWLTGPAKKLDEISRWYMSWKQLFPEALVKDPLIVQQFNYALEMMQSAMQAGVAVKLPPKITKLNYTIQETSKHANQNNNNSSTAFNSSSYSFSNNNNNNSNSSNPLLSGNNSHRKGMADTTFRRGGEVIDLDAEEAEAEKKGSDAFDAANMSFKEVIERLASEYSVLFMPTKRTHESKVIYNFGKASIYIDKNLLYCQQQGRWIPIGIENLLEIAGK